MDVGGISSTRNLASPAKISFDHSPLRTISSRKEGLESRFGGSLKRVSGFF